MVICEAGFKVSVDKKQLQKALEKIATEKSKHLPAMNIIELGVKDGVLTIKATDVENFVSYDLKVEAGTEGKVYVNKQDLLKVLKSIKDEKITLESDNKDATVYDVLKIIAGSSIYKVKLQEENYIEGFKLPEYQINLLARIEGQELLKGLEKGAYALDMKERIYIINKVICFHFYDEYLNIVSIDGYRLAMYRLEATSLPQFGSENKDVKYLLSPQSIKVLEKLIDKKETDKDATVIEIYLHSDNWLSFRGSNWILYSLAFDETYPDYQTILLDSAKQITIDRDRLVDAFKKAVSFVGREAIFFYTKDGQLRIEDKNRSFSETISDGYDTELKIFINAGFVLDAVSRIDSKEVIMEFVDEKTQVQFIPKDKREHYLALVMPIEP